MNPSSCRVGAEQLLSYLNDPTAQPGLSQHISVCSYCQVRLLAMAGGARTRGNDRAECQRVLQEIPALMVAEDRGEAEAAQFWPLRVHLLLCPDCFAAYRELKQMAARVLDDTLPSVWAYRPPDLSFLHPEEAVRPWDLLHALRLNLMLLFQPRQAVPVLAREGKAGPPESALPGEPTHERVWGAEELGELNVEVRLFPDQAHADCVRLEVEAHHITRFEASLRVALQMAGVPEIVRFTDRLGLAEFDGLVEDDLRTAILEIAPAP